MSDPLTPATPPTRLNPSRPLPPRAAMTGPVRLPDPRMPSGDRNRVAQGTDPLANTGSGSGALTGGLLAAGALLLGGLALAGRRARALRSR